MRLPRSRFFRGRNLITICEAIPPPSISKLLKTRRIRIDYLDRSHPRTTREQKRELGT
jgi:hypothetical protein